jgi:signal transduction histidine kinase
MPLSRLRLRLAAWFALAFLGGLLVLSLTLFLYMRRQSDRRFDHQLVAAAGNLLNAVRLEHEEAPESGVEAATAAALEEWPSHPEAFAVYDRAGRQLGVTGPAALAGVFPSRLGAAGSYPIELPGPDGHPVRLGTASGDEPPVQVLVANTTERLEEDAETLALWLAVSVPITALVSLTAGYFLSRRALHPVADLGRAIAGIAPGALDRRLPMNPRPDELDRLASQFNALLDRLERSQARNQRFLEEAAHQIRTPLTLVLGETELALDQAPTSDGNTEALRRIRLAATQMRRRVEELLLLARAEAGERPALNDAVELDGLALECADLMRSRAQALGCRLELSRVDPVVVTGSDPLLREAVVELLENACRHGSSSEPVRISVYIDGREAVVEVSNGIDGESGLEPCASPGHGLGIEVVHWIAAEHGGRLAQERSPSRIVSAIRLLLPASGLPDGG